MRKTRLIAVLIIVLGVLALAGCRTQTSQIDVTQVRAYADPMTENALASLTKNDYAGFSRDFDNTMKQAINQDAFDGLYQLIKTKVGDYRTKEFVQASESKGFMVVIYKANYSLETGVTITISFHEVGGKTLIGGLYLDSPKLRAQ